MGASWGTLGHLGIPWEVLGAPWASSGPPWASWGPLGGFMGSYGGRLGAARAGQGRRGTSGELDFWLLGLLGAPLGILGAPWGSLGGPWGPKVLKNIMFYLSESDIFNLSKTSIFCCILYVFQRLGASWDVYGVSWGPLGGFGGHFGSLLGHLGTSWDPLGGLGGTLGQLGATLGHPGGPLGDLWDPMGAGWGRPGLGRKGEGHRPNWTFGFGTPLRAIYLPRTSAISHRLWAISH